MKQRKWNNNGMTLVEIIVAFAIFATAATILIFGFNGAIKVMVNSNETKEKSQSASGKIELNDGILESGSIKFPAISKEVGTEFMLEGLFQTATVTVSENKKEGTEVIKRVFTAGNLNKAPIPSPPDDSDPIPVIPTKDNAYYSPDSWINEAGKEMGREIFDYGGVFDRTDSLKDYRSRYGQKNKVVTKHYINVNASTEMMLNSGIEQMFFIYSRLNDNQGLFETPFNSTADDSPKIIFHTKFVYLGNEKDPITSIKVRFPYHEDISLGYNVTTLDDMKKTGKLYFNSYDGSQNSVVLYLPKPLTLTREIPGANPEFPKDWKAQVIDPGYYLLPKDTDIIAALYDPVVYDEFIKHKTTFTKSQLASMGIECK